MPYEDIPSVKVTYTDSTFKVPAVTTQPTILIVGPAKSGKTNTFFNVTNINSAELEFGADTEIMKRIHEAYSQGANNLAIVRSGGKLGSWVFTDSAGATLTIVPTYRDDDILGRYALFIENDGTDNRYMVYDLIDENWVYDSSDIYVQDDGVVTVTDTGIDLFQLSDKSDLTTAIKLDTVATTDFVASGTATASFVAVTEGADGITVSRAERYAALESTYFYLDYRDADFVIPTDVYIDDENLADDTYAVAAGTGTSNREKYGCYWKGVPYPGSVEDALGFVWQYRYQGAVYTYMSDCIDYITGSATAAAATLTVCTDLVLTALVEGKGGNAVTLQIDNVAGKTAVVTITESDYGFAIYVEDDITVGAQATSVYAANINTALAAKTLRNGVVANTLVQAVGSTTLGSVVAETHLAGGLGGALLTHQDLTGDAAPVGVTAKFSEATDSQFREVNFGHQLASFCHVASANWAQLVGIISFKPPTSYSRPAAASWVGTLPTYTNDGVDIYIDSPSDNGNGILGTKLLVGKSISSNGYRHHLVENGNSTDSYAYGGFILTKGASLPNGTDWPYGIKDSDEATDDNGYPIDIGKHLHVAYDWPVLNNNYNGGSSYRGPVTALFFGLVATKDSNEEPIGANGYVTNVQYPIRIHSTQINSLSKVRMIGLRVDRENKIGFTTAKNACNPDSTYSRLSTMRCVNEILSGIRSVARPYLGKSFDSKVLLSIQSDIDRYLVSAGSADLHQGAIASLAYTAADRVLGQLTVKLRMVPPFCIESITVNTSLAADESEL